MKSMEKYWKKLDQMQETNNKLRIELKNAVNQYLDITGNKIYVACYRPDERITIIANSLIDKDAEWIEEKQNLDELNFNFLFGENSIIINSGSANSAEIPIDKIISKGISINQLQSIIKEIEDKRYNREDY